MPGGIALETNLHVGDTTDGHLLGGRVRYAQQRHGFRSGIEPVLLAAAIPARHGDTVLEGGSGAGATLLCLAARISGLSGLGIEQDPALVSIAARNAADNGWPALRFQCSDLGSWTASSKFDHACANPPYHPADSTPSPNAHRRSAKQSGDGLLTIWATSLGRALKPRGTLTFVLPAALLPHAAAAFTQVGCPPTAMLPLWPRQGEQARLMLLRGIKGSRSPFRILPGLALHDRDGSFTPGADAILGGGAALPL